MRETCTHGSMRGSRRKTAKSVLRVVEDRAGVPHGASRSTLHPLPPTPEVLDLFSKKRKGVKVTVITSEHYDKKHVPHRKISDDDVKTFNAQCPKLAVRYNESFHDRFLIVDDKELYLIGASLKDLGRKCFAFTKLDPTEIRRIKKSAFAAGAKTAGKV